VVFKLFRSTDFHKVLNRAPKAKLPLLSWAVKEDLDERVFKALNVDDVNVDIKDAVSSRTPLMIAREFGRLGHMKLLTQAGAGFSADGQLRQTPSFAYSVSQRQPANEEE
jgi:hypothetical protein